MSDPRPTAPRSKRGRLTRSADFERVFRRGRSFGNRYLVLHLFPQEESGEDREPRVGLSVSRRVGGAVERNLVKRLLREAFPAHRSRFPAAVDVVIVARPDARGLAEREGLTGIADALGELVSKAAPDTVPDPPSAVSGAEIRSDASDPGDPTAGVPGA